MSAPNNRKWLVFQETIKQHLTEIREECFKPEVKMNFTFIARNPNNPEMDILVSEEADLEELIKFLERTRTRETMEFKGGLPP